MARKSRKSRDKRASRRGPRSAKKRSREATPPASARRPVLGWVDVGVAVFLLFGTWVLLPARWWPIDTLGTVLALLLGAAGFGLIRGEPWAHKVGLAAGGIAFVAGASLVTGLAFTASHLAGLYGPVGQGGALILVVVAALITPYLVIVPGAQLLALARSTPAAPDSKPRAKDETPTDEPSEPDASDDEQHEPEGDDDGGGDADAA